MVEQKGTKKAVGAPKKPAADAVKKPALNPKKTNFAKKSKSLAYGKVKFQAFLWRGKWRFVNKAEADKEKKKKLAKLAKLKEQGVQIKVNKLNCFRFNGYLAQVILERLIE